MRKIDIVWLLIPLGLFLIGWGFYQKVTPLQVGQLSSNQPVGELYGPRRFGQSFSAPYDGLYRVDVLLATYARENTAEITFHLKASPAAPQDLVRIGVKASRIKDNQLQAFTFPHLSSSANQTFFFDLDSPDSRPGDAITIWSHSGNPYPEGIQYIDGSPTESDLAFVAYFKPNPLSLAGLFLERFAQKKPLLLGSPWFYGTVFALYLVLAFLFFRLVALAFPPRDKR